jgi:hypothetical protein
MASGWWQATTESPDAGKIIFEHPQQFHLSARNDVS